VRARDITLPPAPSTVANYVRAVRVGNLLFVSGNAGLLFLTNVRAELGTLDRVKRVVNVLGMVEAILEIE
jgi:enamine deaminase RidA (YjgF/YER057c/UK114 family)